jgi:hypothetical protein
MHAARDKDDEYAVAVRDGAPDHFTIVGLAW